MKSSKEEIYQAAKIYGRDHNRALTSYELAVNEEAGRLASDDPSLLCKRDVLYEKAKECVRSSSTFSFKKGQSRSNLASKSTTPAKRKYTNELCREDHITKLIEDIDGKQKQVKFKLLYQTKAQASKDWETCERLQSEVNMLRKEIHSLEQELKVFKRKQQKSAWFKKKSKSASVKEIPANQSTLFESVNQPMEIEKSTNAEKEVIQMADDSQNMSSGKQVNNNEGEVNEFAVLVTDSSTEKDFV